jgi:hypothetical protein
MYVTHKILFDLNPLLERGHYGGNTEVDYLHFYKGSVNTSHNLI